MESQPVPRRQRLRLGRAVSRPTDRAETAADAAADAAVRGNLWRQADIGAAGDDHAPPIRLSAAPSGIGTPAVGALRELVSGLDAAGGRPLEPGVREAMEIRFGHDFGHVRVHVGGSLAAGAAAIDARAFTYGRHVAFAPGEYAPSTPAGQRLLAHELAHVIQQSSSEPGIHRAIRTIGEARISIDYGDVIRHDTPAEYQRQIEARYELFTGASRGAVASAVAALSDTGRRWVLFGIDLLADNPVAGLDRVVAVQRLIDYAPIAATSPLGAVSQDFPTEVARVSGWLEWALTTGLKEPGAVAQHHLDREYNPDAGAGAASSTCPASRPADRQLDAPRLRKDLDTLMRGYLNDQVTELGGRTVATESVVDIAPVADLVQAAAIRFFAPFIGRSHTRSFQTSWTYSKHLTPSTAPDAIPAEMRRAFLDNRARLWAAKAGLFKATHFDARCVDDEAVFAQVIDALDSDPSVRADVATLQSWKSFTVHDGSSAEVTLNLQHDSADGACDARWKTVESLCHELMHVYVSQDFLDLSRDRQVIREGFTEILGDQLYERIRADAEGRPAVRRQFEQGLPEAACTEGIRRSTRGYGPAADAAEHVRVIVGDRNFRGAYFLGRTGLAGLRPTLRVGDAHDPLERDADRAATAAMSRSGTTVRATAIAPASMVQRQPRQPQTPQDRDTVARAKARLSVLEPALARAERQVHAVEADRLRVLADRRRLDDEAADPTIRRKREMEEQHWSQLNLAPVTVSVRSDAIVIAVRFHLRFEDPAMRSRSTELENAVRAGIELIWRPQLTGSLAGHTFTLEPTFTTIGATAARDRNFWLITVRKVNTGVPVTYPGCQLEQPDKAIPTSVTDPLCDGGVMSIPPVSIGEPGVLGHELLHLFGLVDRYLTMTPVKGGRVGRPTLVPVRETPGRRDPLGGEDATILREDLGYVLDKLGVYRRVAEGPQAVVDHARIEVERLRRIVELGYDPDSFVRGIPPKDFRGKVIKSAEDL
ncbi:MAG: DUF4157 domain-containing protein [Candidatus Dormibacteria bacterium]